MTSDLPVEKQYGSIESIKTSSLDEEPQVLLVLQALLVSENVPMVNHDIFKCHTRIYWIYRLRVI